MSIASCMDDTPGQDGKANPAKRDDKGDAMVYRRGMDISRETSYVQRECPMAAKKRKTRRQLPKPSSASRMPQPPTADVLVYTTYDITDEPLDNRDIKKLPSQVQARIDDLYALAQHDPQQAIPELERLDDALPPYPHVCEPSQHCLSPQR